MQHIIIQRVGYELSFLSLKLPLFCWSNIYSVFQTLYSTLHKPS